MIVVEIRMYVCYGVTSMRRTTISPSLHSASLVASMSIMHVDIIIDEVDCLAFRGVPLRRRFLILLLLVHHNQINHLAIIQANWQSARNVQESRHRWLWYVRNRRRRRRRRRSGSSSRRGRWMKGSTVMDRTMKNTS